MGLALGDRVQLGARYSGTVEYIGNLVGKEGVWVGLRLDGPLGTNDGTYNGVRYFHAEDKYGLFAKYTRLEKMQLDAHLSVNKIPGRAEHSAGAVESFEVSYADRGTECAGDAANASHKAANSDAAEKGGLVSEESDGDREAHHASSSNVFVRYDSNYINRLKDKIRRLSLALKEEREQRAMQGSGKRQGHLQGRGERMAALSRDVSAKVRSIRGDIDALDALVKDLKDKVRVPRDRSDLSGLLESIVLSIVKEDVDELNKGLSVYAKKVHARGIKFEI